MEGSGAGSGSESGGYEAQKFTDPAPEHWDLKHRFPSSDTYQDQGVETEVVKNEVECFLENMAQVESLWILKLNQR
jgi:hypothetical protein